MGATSGMAAREKRSLDASNSEEGEPDRKRPALARYLYTLRARVCTHGYSHCYRYQIIMYSVCFLFALL